MEQTLFILLFFFSSCQTSLKPWGPWNQPLLYGWSPRLRFPQSPPLLPSANTIQNGEHSACSVTQGCLQLLVSYHLFAATSGLHCMGELLWPPGFQGCRAQSVALGGGCYVSLPPFYPQSPVAKPTLYLGL